GVAVQLSTARSETVKGCQGCRGTDGASTTSAAPIRRQRGSGLLPGWITTWDWPVTHPDGAVPGGAVPLDGSGGGETATAADAEPEPPDPGLEPDVVAHAGSSTAARVQVATRNSVR